MQNSLATRFRVREFELCGIGEPPRMEVRDQSREQSIVFTQLMPIKTPNTGGSDEFPVISIPHILFSLTPVEQCCPDSTGRGQCSSMLYFYGLYMSFLLDFNQYSFLVANHTYG